MHNYCVKRKLKIENVFFQIKQCFVNYIIIFIALGIFFSKFSQNLK